MSSLPPRSSRPSRTFYDSAIHPPLRLILGFALVGLIGLLSFGIYWFTLVPVTVTVNGHTTIVRTHQTTVTGLLHEIGVDLNEADIIAPPLQTPIHNALNVVIETAHPVVVDMNGQLRQVLVHSNDSTSILKAANVIPGDHDQLTMNGLTDLMVIRAQPVQIEDGAQPVQVAQTTAQTVSGALADAGIALYMADSVTPPLDSPIVAGMPIIITRSQPITVHVDGQTLNTRTQAKTVGEALSALQIGLVGQDHCIPAPDQPITPALAIRVIRVTETEESTQVAIPFSTVLQASDGLLAGQQRVISPGVPGMALITVLIRREDGVLVSRSTPLRYVIQPPQFQIIGVSPADLPTSTPGKSPDNTIVVTPTP